MSLFHIIIISIALITASHAAEKPNILFILADDLGWGNVGFHNKENDEIHTPYIDDLVANGLELYRHYVYSGCAPSRASLQTGRLPIHVTTNNGDGIDDPAHGIPLEMTTMGTKLQNAGYHTHLVGKWDCGMATYAQLPTQKGYDTFFGYLSKSISYFEKLADNECDGSPFIDLWSDNEPAFTSMDQIDDEIYIEFTFATKVKELITGYGQQQDEETNPFFIMYSMHLPHYPSEIPAEYLDSFDDDENYCADNNDYIYPGFTDGTLFKCRSALQSQVKLMDAVIGGVIETLKAAQLWDNTLIVFSSDNGGSLELDSTAGNNWPLRGGKGNNLEGGVRATSFVSGGYLPQERAGDIEMGLMHLADWYATFCALAGVEASDDYATEHGLPGVDGLNMWPLISGQVSESPRSELAISHDTFIWNEYKLLTGTHKTAIWQSSLFPNSSSQTEGELETNVLSCKKEGCLFNVVDDPSEYDDLSQMDAYSDVLSQMRERMAEINTHIWQNEEEGVDSCPDDAKLDSMSCGCWMAYNNYNYFVGPYQDLTVDQMNYLDDDDDESTMMIDMQMDVRQRGHDYVYFILSILGFAALIFAVRCVQAIGTKNKNVNGLNDGQNTSYGTAL